MSYIKKIMPSYEQTADAQKAAADVQKFNDLNLKIDNEIQTRTENFTDLTNKYNLESATRTAETVALYDALNLETDTRAAQIADLQNDLKIESDTRSSQVANLKTALNLETSTRKSETADIYQKLNNEINTRADEVRTLNDKIDNEIQASANFNTSIQQQLTAEIAARSQEDINLNNKINSEIQNRLDCDTGLQRTLNNEIQQRQNQDTALRDEFSSAMTLEEMARDNKIDNLRESLTAVISANKSAQDTINLQLQNAISQGSETQSSTFKAVTDKITNDLNSEIQNRTNADNTLNNKIAAESSTRLTQIANTERTLKAYTDDKASVTLNDSKHYTDDKVSSGLSIAQAYTDNKASATLNDSKLYTDEKVSSGLSIAQAYTDNKTSNILNDAKSYTDEKISAVNINDFTAPTASATGQRGLVPAPPKGTDLKILTSQGWRTASDSTLTIPNLPSQSGTLTFNNNNQSPAWLNFDTTKLSISGTTSAKNAGTYTVNFTPLDMYIWSDTKNQNAKSQTWQIDKMKLTKPSASVTEFNYDGNSKTLSLSNFDANYMSVTGNSNTGAGSFSCTVSLKDTNNTCWSDNSTSNVVITWKINPLKLNKPTASVTEFTYDGNAKTLELSNFDSSYMNVTGNSNTGADSYSCTVSLKNKTNTCWSDGTTADVVITWKINPLKLNKPTASVTEFTYDGNAKTLNLSNFNSSYMNVTGNSNTGAGSYSCTVSLKNTTNTKWSDNSTSNVVINWKINPLKLNKPAASVTEFNYDGNSKTLELSNFNSSYMSQTGTTSASTPGSYSVTFSLKNKTNTTWSDGTTADVVINWSIANKKLTQAQSTGFSAVGTYTYNSSEQEVNISNYDSSIHKLTGDLKKTAAGNYTAYIEPADGWRWYDGTADKISVTWTIATLKLNKPTASNTNFTFNNETQNLNISNFNSSYMNQTGTTSSLNTGNFSVTYKLKDTTNTKWSDGTTADVVINWKIEKLGVTYPALLTSSFDYDGNTHSPTFASFEDYFELGSTTSAKNAGEYTVTIKLKSPYKENAFWNNAGSDVYGTADDVNFTWYINPKKITKPTADVTDFDYDGNLKTLTVKNYDSNYMTQSGTLSNTAAGTYTVTYSLKDKTNTAWNDDTTADVVIDWYITLNLIPEEYSSGFAQNGTLTFNQAVQEVKITNYASGYHTLSGVTSASDAGTYTAYIEPKAGKYWSDGTNDKKAVQWTIDKFKFGKAYFYLDLDTYYYTGEVLDEGKRVYIRVNDTMTFIGKYLSYFDVSGTTTATNLGDYEITVSLKDKNNTAWTDDTNDDVTLTWHIAPRTLKISTDYFSLSVSEFEYTGSAITITENDIVNFDSTYHKISADSVVEATVPGTYTITVEPQYGYIFSGSTPNARTVTWTIVRQKLEKPVLAESRVEAGRGSRRPTFTNYSFGKGSIDTDPQGTVLNRIQYVICLEGDEVGDATYAPANYTVRLTLLNTELYCWDDGTTDDLELPWEVYPHVLTAEESNYDNIIEYQYTGETIHLVIPNLPDRINYRWAEMTGFMGASLVGTYTTKIVLKNYAVWNDGTTDPKYQTWRINPIPVSENAENVALAAETMFKPVSGTEGAEGEEQFLADLLINFDPDYLELSGEVSATYPYENEQVGITPTKRTAYVKPKQNYGWADGTTDARVVTWYITPYAIPTPAFSPNGGKMIDGVLTYEWNDYEPTGPLFDEATVYNLRTLGVIRVFGNLQDQDTNGDGKTHEHMNEQVTGTGDFTIRFRIGHRPNVMWSTLTDQPYIVSLNFRVVQKELPVPYTVGSTTLAYTGKSIGPTVLDFDSNYMVYSTIPGYPEIQPWLYGPVAEEPGNYGVYAEPIDPIHTVFQTGLYQIPIYWEIVESNKNGGDTNEDLKQAILDLQRAVIDLYQK